MKQPISEVYHGDCMDFMRDLPSGYFGLAICDPPYGIGADIAAKKQGGQKYGNAAARKKNYHTNGWDSLPMSDGFFEELRRVSKNSIIWGQIILLAKFRLIHPLG